MSQAPTQDLTQLSWGQLQRTEQSAHNQMVATHGGLDEDGASSPHAQREAFYRARDLRAACQQEMNARIKAKTAGRISEGFEGLTTTQILDL